MSAGIVLVVAGIWVAVQVLGGDALQRTGVVSSDQSTANWNVDPNSGIPNQDPNKPLLRDPQGRPY